MVLRYQKIGCQLLFILENKSELDLSFFMDGTRIFFSSKAPISKLFGDANIWKSVCSLNHSMSV